MNKAEHLKPWMWRPGESGNPTGSKPKPRRSFDAVRRFEALQVDPLQEVITLAQDPALPKPLRLKAWLTFRQELSTLPDDTKAALEKMDTKGEIGPIIMQVLLKFVEMPHEQAKAQNPEQPGLKAVKL